MMISHLCKCQPPSWDDPHDYLCSWCQEQADREHTGADQIEAQQDIEADSARSDNKGQMTVLPEAPKE
jgi:hypothetical protein